MCDTGRKFSDRRKALASGKPALLLQERGSGTANFGFERLGIEPFAFLQFSQVFDHEVIASKDGPQHGIYFSCLDRREILLGQSQQQLLKITQGRENPITNEKADEDQEGNNGGKDETNLGSGGVTDILKQDFPMQRFNIHDRVGVTQGLKEERFLLFIIGLGAGQKADGRPQSLQFLGRFRRDMEIIFGQINDFTGESVQLVAVVIAILRQKKIGQGGLDVCRNGLNPVRIDHMATHGFQLLKVTKDHPAQKDENEQQEGGQRPPAEEEGPW